MGKNNKKGSKGPKANVFKVAGAKSLKKTKAKPVNLGLKNLKQKVQAIDKEFIEVSKKAKPAAAVSQPKGNSSKKSVKKVTKDEVAKTAEDIVKMDL